MDISNAIQELGSTDLAKRRQAAEFLARAGEAARPAAVPLVRGSADDDESVREWVVEALENLGAASREDLPALAALVANPHQDVSYWAVTLLGRFEASGILAIPTLSNALVKHPSLNVKQRAAWALGMIGARDADAEQALAQATTANDSRLARTAQHALERIRGQK